MGVVYLALIILFIVFMSKGKSSGGYSGGSGDGFGGPGALPPDMYDPLYDYDHDGKMSEHEKMDQTMMWFDMWSDDE